VTSRKASWLQQSNLFAGLPLDMTQNEFAELMGKCGIIMPNPVSGEPKLKLYADESGNLKGDGRCCYLKVKMQRD